MCQHSFHDCPLRSCSLLIISSEKQSIVTATDKVFNVLGYEPHQLIGKSIHILNPRPHKNGYLFQHESQGHRLFEVCIHRDPLQTTIDLEYWLIKPKNDIVDTPMTILRLCPFGTIEHAYPSNEFPQSSLELMGHPIMSFIHHSDVRMLCEKLKQCKIYDTFSIRWLKRHPKDGDQDDYMWLSFTVIHTPSHHRRLSCSTMHDPQTRPICIIRPVTEDTKEATTTMLTAIWTFAKDVIMQQGLDIFYAILDEFNKAINQGKTYMVEYFAHVVTHILKLMCDITNTLEENTAHKSSLLMAHRRITSVKVTIDNYIWSVPLLDSIIKRSSSQENLLDSKKS